MPKLRTVKKRMKLGQMEMVTMTMKDYMMMYMMVGRTTKKRIMMMNQPMVTMKEKKILSTMINNCRSRMMA